MFSRKLTYVISLKIAALSLLCTTLSTQVSALTINAVGDSFSIDFDSAASPGLTSTADFLVSDISTDALGGQTWTLDVLLSNTSSTPITDARVSILGFNTDSSFDAADSSVTGIFGMVASGNMPIAGDLDVCFKAGGGTSNCAGGGGGGVAIGDSGSFSIMLNYDVALTSLVLDDFFVRYQSVVGATSAAGIIGSGTQVPVPSSMMFMTSGLIALASIGRTRRKATSL